MVAEEVAIISSPNTRGFSFGPQGLARQAQLCLEYSERSRAVGDGPGVLLPGA